MTIDIKTLKVEPRRNTFGHIARRLGADKPASRYEEGTLDVQATANFHYKPLWDTAHWHYDETRTAVRMRDWYVLRDPRQYYYATYNIARATQHQATERNFEFVEKRGMMTGLTPEWRDAVGFYLLPLRHVEWGANMNCTDLCDRGYGTAVTAPCIFSAGDHLGMAQIIGRIGLMLDGNLGNSLDAAKSVWMNAPEWQPLRKLVEDSFVIKDWFELFVAQNLCLDGLLYPLVYGQFETEGRDKGGTAVSMLTEFMNDWFAEHSRWVDSVIKAVAAESPENKALLCGWFKSWGAAVSEALMPLALRVLGSGKGPAAVDICVSTLKKRAAALGLAV
ncbi:MAG TPA: aromatic/alkene monooxygenase hydroxylase subunit beta [Candidatus Sulfotelmatobacter sp.]|nr:aromatic/alkene monooxygenase hydroxylase subunit beta [Candidatus Sulfotelmatobacter sp.]